MVILLIKPKKNYGNPTYKNQRRTMVILLTKTKQELWLSYLLKPKKNYGNPTHKNQRRTMVILLIKTKEELW